MATPRRREYNRTYYKAHREKMIEKSRQYRSIHRDKRNEYNRKYRMRHYDKVVAANKLWRKQNPDKAKAIRRKERLKRYGITQEEYNKILDRQDGKCAICRIQFGSTKRSFAVDHNHETNEVRGILCHRCNQAIGLLREDPAIIARAISYVQAGGQTVKTPR